jgi:hypothetical protein
MLQYAYSVPVCVSSLYFSSPPIVHSRTRTAGLFQYVCHSAKMSFWTHNKIILMNKVYSYIGHRLKRESNPDQYIRLQTAQLMCST